MRFKNQESWGLAPAPHGQAEQLNTDCSVLQLKTPGSATFPLFCAVPPTMPTMKARAMEKKLKISAELHLHSTARKNTIKWANPLLEPSMNL